jgi:hypothetical protein
MGYRGHDEWHDMSDHVVHFTKPVDLATITPPPARPDPKRATLAETLAEIAFLNLQDRTGYHPWLEILGSRELKAGEKPLGAARRVRGVEPSQRCVCFSEIPLDMLDRLIQLRSLFGVGFAKSFIVANGGAPLWYLDKDGIQAPIIRAQIEQRVADGVDPDDPFWKLTPFIDHPGSYAGRPYRFEWEREWRVIGDMRFREDDVAFLFLPEEDHDTARQFFVDAEVENRGPAYLGAYIDPRWDMQRIQDALKNVPTPPPPSPEATPWWDWHDPFG